MDSSFSLKDQLFNNKKVTLLARNIKEVYSSFDAQNFVEIVITELPKLELKERITCIRKTLQKFLPQQYREAVTILLASLPSPLDPNKTDDDFGDFILAPYSDFVAQYGCTIEDLLFSLSSLKEMTKRFSAEDSIRFFIRAFPKETMITIEQWSKDTNYHVRRLASEGTRPKLPWSQKVELDDKVVISTILKNLYTDNTRYVVRSVANHLNDISKTDSSLVIKTLTEWNTENKKSNNQSDKEMKYLTSHALRTLIKKGNQDALALLGYSPTPQIEISQFSIHTRDVAIGEAAQFSFHLHSQKTEPLLINYVLGFIGKNGKHLPKVFSIQKKVISSGETTTIEKNHSLKPMTTKTLYAGKHSITLLINGQEYGTEYFNLHV